MAIVKGRTGGIPYPRYMGSYGSQTTRAQP